MVTEQVTTQWVMEAHRSSVAEDMHQEDVVQPVEGVETGSEVSIVLPPIKPNVIPITAEPSVVVPTTTELPSSSPITPSTDAAEGSQ